MRYAPSSSYDMARQMIYGYGASSRRLMHRAKYASDRIALSAEFYAARAVLAPLCRPKTSALWHSRACGETRDTARLRSL